MKRIALGLALAACAPAEPGPRVFAPDVISGAGWESHPAVSPDGALLLFVRSDANFGNWKILESRLERGAWSEPRMSAFSGAYLDADPFFSEDGQTLWFISNRPGAGKSGGDLDIWTVARSEIGWSEPERLPEPVNSPGAEWFPRLASDGALYFGSDRTGGNGATDIYVARRIDGEWRVENLGAPISTAGDEYEFEIAPNGAFAFLMASREGELGGGDIFLTYRDGDGWSEPVNLGPTVNSTNLEVGPLIGRDGKTFYWSSARDESRLGDIYTMPAREALKLVPKP
jgi:hypothetical protein